MTVFLSTKKNGFIRLEEKDFKFISSNWELEYIEMESPMYFTLSDRKVEATMNVNDYEKLTEVLYEMPDCIKRYANMKIKNNTLNEKFNLYKEEYLRDNPDIIIMDIKLNNKLKNEFERLYGSMINYYNRDEVKNMNFDVNYSYSYTYIIHISVDLSRHSDNVRRTVVNYANDKLNPVRINIGAVDFKGYFKIK